MIDILKVAKFQWEFLEDPSDRVEEFLHSRCVARIWWGAKTWDFGTVDGSTNPEKTTKDDDFSHLFMRLLTIPRWLGMGFFPSTVSLVAGFCLTPNPAIKAPNPHFSTNRPLQDFLPRYIL